MKLIEWWAHADNRTRDAVVDAIVFKQSSGFWCPECQGGHFRSEGPLDGLHRYCHDEFSIGCRWDGTHEESVPPYSTDRKFVWVILDRMEGLGKGLMLTTWTGHRTAAFRAFTSHTSDDLCHAICVAALMALDVKEVAI